MRIFPLLISKPYDNVDTQLSELGAFLSYNPQILFSRELRTGLQGSFSGLALIIIKPPENSYLCQLIPS